MTTTQLNVLDGGFVRLIDEPDSDLKVVNAARVSFHKTSQWARTNPSFDGSDQTTKVLDAGDAKLIRYLAKHHHWTPFAHCNALVTCDLAESGEEFPLRLASLEGVRTILDYDRDLSYHRMSLAHLPNYPSLHNYFHESLCHHSVCSLLGLKPEDGHISGSKMQSNWRECPLLAPVTLHLKMPIFVARQFMRSNIGIVYNEISRRYVDEAPEFHVPAEWRGRPDKMKQGSKGVVDLSTFLRAASPGQELGSSDPALSIGFMANHIYQGLLGAGVAPEMARMVLPVSMYTEFWATMDLMAAARVHALRIDPHAQWEVQQFAKALDEAILMSQWAEFWPTIRDNTLKEYAIE